MMAQLLRLSTIKPNKYRGDMPSRAEMARTHDLVQSFLALSERMRRHYATRVAELDLTPTQAHLLRELAPGPRPMGELAERLACDASNVTGLADRLEARDLVERRASPGDRRVKVLALTEEGERVQRQLWERLMTGSPITAGLGKAEQEDLRVLLHRLVEASAAPAGSTGGPCGPTAPA
jgi:MarR family transcriptional regulator, organic hydroperoxide resistance regulator